MGLVADDQSSLPAFLVPLFPTLLPLQDHLTFLDYIYILNEAADNLFISALLYFSPFNPLSQLHPPLTLPTDRNKVFHGGLFFYRLS